MKRVALLVVALGLPACPAKESLPSEASQECVARKEAEAIAAGRVEREGPGAVNEWALRQCGVDKEKVLLPIEADNLRKVQSTRPKPPGAR